MVRYLLAPDAGATLGVLMVHVLCLRQQSHQILTTSPRTNNLAYTASVLVTRYLLQHSRDIS